LGIIREVDSQIQCFAEWDMEYWRNPGDWNVSVDLNGLSSDETTVGYWPLDSVNASNYTLDQSKWHNDGVLINSTLNSTHFEQNCSDPTCPHLVPGKFWNALEFDGYSDYVAVPYHPSLDVRKKLTIEAWVYHRKRPPQPTGWEYQTILAKSDPQSNGYYFTINDTGALCVFLGNVTGWPYRCSSSTVELNTWSHVAVVFNGTHIKFYKNGILDDYIYATSNDIISLTTTGVGIGRHYHWNDSYFNGSIDEVKLWNRVLSDAEINASYNSGTVRNFTSQNFTYNSLSAIDINVSTINFTGLPGETVNSTSAYPLSIKNTGNVKVNVSINGSDFIGETDPSYIVGIGNVSYNESETGNFINLTHDYALVFSFLNPAEERYLYFKAYIPTGFLPQFYNNTIGTKKVST
jgi:hypothetical protein